MGAVVCRWVVRKMAYYGQLGASYYRDADGDDEGATRFQWYRVDDAGGSNPDPIPGATGWQYFPTADDIGKYLMVTVVLVAQTGLPKEANPMSVFTSGPIIP